MKLPIIAGNWKMHKTQKETRAFFQELLEALPPKALDYCMIAPPFLALETAVQVTKEIPLRIAAQNCHGEQEGAYTGEVSPPMLQEIGVYWTLIGHSERRHVIGESQKVISQRVEGALRQGMHVIYCIGETLEEREKGATLKVLEAQTESLNTLKPFHSKLVLAYEPVWAIGTGKHATPDQIEDVHLWLSAQFPEVPILYGGSVKPSNIQEIMELASVHGVLVGGASLQVDSFYDIVMTSLHIKGIAL